MKRLFFTIFMALIFFSLLNFVYCNLDSQTFAYRMVFKFYVPVILPGGFQSVPLPLGFILLISFCSGMIFIALVEAIPSFYKSLELRAKNKKIRELERELTVARQIAGVEKKSSNS